MSSYSTKFRQGKTQQWSLTMQGFAFVQQQEANGRTGRHLPGITQAAQEHTVFLGKGFTTRTNKPEQTQGVKGAQLKAATHCTTQGNPALLTLRLGQANFAMTTSLLRFKAQNVLFPLPSCQAQATLVGKKKQTSSVPGLTPPSYIPDQPLNFFY